MKKFLSKWKIELFFGLATLVLGLVLRVVQITKIPIFADEAIYIRWSQVMRAEETLRFLPLSDGKQPLFMWITIPFLKIFSDPLVAGRIVSAVAGIGTIFGIFVLAYVLFFSIELSLITAFLYSISPFSVFFDRLALADSLLSFFGIWTLIFIIISVKKIRLDTAMLAGFTLGGALLTKSPGIYFALMSPLTLILAKWDKTMKERFLKLCVYFFLFFFTYLIGIGIYNILRLGPNFHLIASRNQDYVYPLTHLLKSPFDPFKPFISRIFQYFWIMGTFEIIALFVFGTFLGFKKNKKVILLLLIWCLAPVFASAEFSKTMTARYVYFSVPYVFILASLSFFEGIKKTIKKATGKVLFVIFGIFVIHSLFVDYKLIKAPEDVNLPRSERSGYLEEWTSGYGIHEVASYLKKYEIQNPTKKIVVGTEGYFGTLPDGLQIYLDKNPEITVIGVGQPISKLPNSLLESYAAGNSTYLLVNDTRLLAKPEDIGLKLISTYAKAGRPDGKVEHLDFFEVKLPVSH